MVSERKTTVSPLQNLAWVVLGDYVERGRRTREEVKNIRNSYCDLLKNSDRYTLRFEKTGKKAYILTVRDALLGETEEVPVGISFLVENAELYKPLIEKANQEYESRRQKEQKEKTLFKEQRRKRFNSGLKSVIKTAKRGFLLSLITIPSTLGIKSCYNHINSPEYTRKKELDAKARSLIPQRREVVTYELGNGKEVNVILLNTYEGGRFNQNLVGWFRNRLAFELENLTLISEGFAEIQTSEGDAKNLAKIKTSEDKIFSIGEAQNYQHWQKFYEDLIEKLSDLQPKKRIIVPTIEEEQEKEKKKESEKLEAILQELSSQIKN